MKLLLRARREFRAFVGWQKPHEPYYWGAHTIAIVAMVQEAIERLEAGGRYYGICITPPRHGKSDLISRRAPVWALIRRPQTEIILTSYGGSLANEMSLAARRCFTEAGRYYGLELAEERSAVDDWKTTGGGSFHAVGLGGSITGRGAELLILDDYCKSREEAESPSIRNKTWDAWTNDLLTRLGRAHAVIVVATRWHEDDLIGRLLKEPRWKVIHFKAHDGEKWLFPEMFPEQWYEQQRAAIGSHAWNALYQGEPAPREGAVFCVENIGVLDNGELAGRAVRAWDLGSTVEGDWTVGVKLVEHNGGYVVADVVRVRKTALERDAIIKRTAQAERGVRQIIEAVGGYVDTANRLRADLMGEAVVKGAAPKSSKQARATILEPIIEAGRLQMLKAPWNAELIGELRSFPFGGHDDQVDALVAAFEELSRGGLRAWRVG